MDNFEEKNRGYWNERSRGYSSLRQKELSGPDSRAWERFLMERLPKGRPLRVLCQNGNASFPFQRVGVHDTFCHFLVVPENMTLFQHGIDKSRLAMVDMGDNGNVADIFSFHSFFFPLGYYKINVSLLLYHKDAKLFISRKYNSLYHGFSCLRRFFIFLPEERLPKGCGKISALYPQLPGAKRNPCRQGEGFHSL
jgi:hypothetical protein